MLNKLDFIHENIFVTNFVKVDFSSSSGENNSQNKPYFLNAWFVWSINGKWVHFMAYREQIRNENDSYEKIF